ncbi:hypothetical protein ACI6Q2_02360 [Chitinophagaceae bacterium LWZ2-11]
MKKLFVLAAAAFLISGSTFAQQGGNKKDAKAKDQKECCKKSDKDCCKKDKDGKSKDCCKKDAKTATTAPVKKG